MIYLRLLFVALWMVISCAIGIVLCLVQWGDLSLNRHFARVFSWGVLKICGVTIELEGREHLYSRQPCVYVANHQSALDMATFGWMFPRRTVVVGKRELLYIPVFGLYFKAAGNIVLNRQKRVSAIADLIAAARSIRERQVSVWIFPEGTRNTRRETMLPFKKGAFYMALQAKVPIVPILCSPLDEILDWKARYFRPGVVRIRVLPPIETTSWGEKDADRLSDVVREKMLETLRELST